MIESVHFKNFKALRDAALPLGRFTLLVGPNGSGKSTAMAALKIARSPSRYRYSQVVTADLQDDINGEVEVSIDWNVEGSRFLSVSGWRHDLHVSEKKFYGPTYHFISGEDWSDVYYSHIADTRLEAFRIFSFDAERLAETVLLNPGMQLEANGRNLAGVMDNLRDSHPEKFEALNAELNRWLPEFDRITFETPEQGRRALLLRTTTGKHRIPAADLSQGILFALAFLTISYLPNPPAFVCFEEPEKGMHPRLLREIRDGMYRLCYPEEYGEKRDPVQIVATTHSPYLLDLYRDHTEEIVIAHKDERGVHFERLSEKPNINEFLQDAPLGEVWYSGILGGVPTEP